MKIFQIVVILIAILFVGVIFGIKLWKMANHKPTDTCEECHERMRNAVRRMRKAQAKKRKKEEKEKARLESEAKKVHDESNL